MQFSEGKVQQLSSSEMIGLLRNNPIDGRVVLGCFYAGIRPFYGVSQRPPHLTSDGDWVVPTSGWQFEDRTWVLSGLSIWTALVQLHICRIVDAYVSFDGDVVAALRPAIDRLIVCPPLVKIDGETTPLYQTVLMELLRRHGVMPDCQPRLPPGFGDLLYAGTKSGRGDQPAAHV